MTRARELARLANENVLSVEDDSLEVGINSTTPTSALDVRGQLNVGTTIKAGTAGVVTATEFSGSIGTFSGAGSFGGNLDVTGNVTIGGTLTYEDVTNIDSVGIVTARAGVNVSGGQLQVGVAYSVGNAGVCTAAGFVGPLTGNVTGNVSGSSGSATGNAGGLTGTPNISCGTIAGSTGTFSSDLSIAQKIVHTGDTHTYIDFGSDSIALNTAGSLALQVVSDQKVGIGTNNPQQQLDVRDTTAGVIRVSNASKSADFICNATGGLIRTIGSYPLVFNTNQTDIARFDASGRLLIGTTTEGYVSADDLTVATSGNTGITIRSGTGSLGTLAFSDGTSGAAEYDGYIQYSQSDQNMMFGTGGGNQTLSIQSTGKIANDGKSASGFGSPDLLIAGVGTAHNIVCMQNSSSTGDCASIGFRVAGESGGDYTKVGIFAQRTATDQGWNNLDLVFAHNTVANSGQVMVADEKFRFMSTGVVDINNSSGQSHYQITQASGNTVKFGIVSGSNIELSGTSNNAMYFKTNNTERLRITGGGKVGIGSDAPGKILSITDSVGGGVECIGTNAGFYFGTQAGQGFQKNSCLARAAANGYHISGSTVGDLCFAAESEADIIIGTSVSAGAMAERMRIHHDGDISFGATGSVASEKFTFQGGSEQLVYFDHSGTDDHSCVQVRHRGATGSTYRTQISFLDDNADQVGSIRSHGSATQYNTSSDYRLKENAVSITDGIERLKTLKPYRFNFKEDPSITVDGFFAHEVTAVPEAISGEKDGEEMQGMDYGRITPLLTAALQEAIAEIETLKAKVASLESN